MSSKAAFSGMEKGFHNVSTLLPLMTDEALAELANDIKANGLREAIWLHPDGTIIDGRNRYRACALAAVEPRFRTWDGAGSLVAFVLSQNLHRRHLTTAQRAAVAAEALPMLEVEAKERQREGAQRGGAAPRSHSTPAGQATLLPTSGKVVAKIPQPTGPKTRDLAAKTTNVAPRYVSDAKKIREQAPEVFERMKAGTLTMQDAKREVRAVEARKVAAEQPLPAEDAAIIAALKRGKAVVLNQERHAHAMTWAEQHGKVERVDRASPWGNVFLLDQDGTRDEVCDHYRDHYLPFKPSLLRRIKSLRGQALICHCAPQRCHADELAKRANGETT